VRIRVHHRFHVRGCAVEVAGLETNWNPTSLKARPALRAREVEVAYAARDVAGPSPFERPCEIDVRQDSILLQGTRRGLQRADDVVEHFVRHLLHLGIDLGETAIDDPLEEQIREEEGEVLL